MNRLHRLAIIVILLVGFVLPELSHAQLTLTSKDLPRAINETSGLEVNNGLSLMTQGVRQNYSYLIKGRNV